MKVLQLAKNHPSVFYGGIETVVKSINLSHKQKQDTIHCVVKEGTHSKVFKVIDRNFFYLKRFLWIYKNINSYDLIYIHLPNILTLFPALFFCKNRKKLVCVYHSDVLKFSLIGKLYQLVTHFLLNFISTIICSSDELISSSKTLSFYREKCHVIPFTISPVEETFSSQSIAEDYILMIAREGHYKGVDFALSALRDYSGKVKIIGTKRVSFNNIEFLGFVSEKEKWGLLEGCKFLLVASSSSAESYGMAIVEAFSRSKTVVAPNLGTGVNFLVKDNLRGILFTPLDQKLLLESIIKLSDDNKLRKSLEQNVSDFFSSTLSFEVFHENLSALLRKILSI